MGGIKFTSSTNYNMESILCRKQVTFKQIQFPSGERSCKFETCFCSLLGNLPVSF